MKSQNPLERARQSFLKAVPHAVVQNRKRAKLGWRRSDTDVALNAPGNRGELYITWTQEGTRDTAINEAGVPHSRLLPVLIERRSEVNYIVGIDFSDPLAIAAITNNQFGTPAHPLTSHSDVTTGFPPSDGVTFVYNEADAVWEYGSFPTDEYIEDLIAATISATAPIGSSYDDGTGELELYLAASAADKMLYSTGVDTWAEAALTSFARGLLDDADAATMRATLGLVIGTNVQAYDAELAAIAGLTSAADRLPYFTGSGTASLATLTAFARTLLDDVDQAAMQATLALTPEHIQDLVGAMWSGNTMTGGTITYQDSDGTLDFVLDTEYVQDIVGALLVDGNGIDLTYNDGTPSIVAALTTLTSDWDIGEDRRILLEALRARDNEGILFEDDGGNLSISIADGGVATIGNPTSVDAIFRPSTGTNVASLIRVIPRGAPSAANGRGLAQFFNTDFIADGSNYEYANFGFVSDTFEILSNKAGTGTLRPINIYTFGNANQLHLATSGFNGMGTSSPQGKLHIHDGTGGWIFSTKTAVNTTPQFIVPDGTGDVVRGLFFISVVMPSSGSVFMTSNAIANGGNVDIYNSGGNVLNLRCNANGSVDVRSTSGAATYSVSLHMVWL